MAEKSGNRARYIRIALRFFSLLPLPLVHAVGALGGLILAITPNKLRRVSLVNISLCYPHRSRSWQRKLMRGSLMELGKTFAEFGPLWYWNKERIGKKVVEVYDQDVLDTAVAEGKGVLIAAPHLGSWELAGLHICQRYPMTVLFRPSRIDELNPFLIKARQRIGIKTAPIDARGIKAVVIALAKGEAVGMLPDQEPKQGNGVFAPLFDVPAYTPIILSKMSSRKQVPVVFTMMERLPFGKGFSMHYVRASDKIYSADTAVAGREINRCVEKCISIAPEQYMWNYKRFRTLPDGSKRNYKKPARDSIDERWHAVGVPLIEWTKRKLSGRKRRLRRRPSSSRP